MLSRYAEDLLWTGRYLERAEDTARMLDVTYHGLLESPPPEKEQAWLELLQVLFLDEVYEGELSAIGVSHFLVLDDKNPSSIRSAVARARLNAQGVRDSISTELFEAINTFHLELTRRDLGRELERQPYQLYRTVKTLSQTVRGVAEATMPRDEGYRFLLVGSLLERAEMTCRLLAVRFGTWTDLSRPRAFHWWVALLKSVSAFEAYLKSNRAGIDSVRVLEFLLLNREFPRSALFCLEATERQLGRLVAEGSAPVLRSLGRVRARLEYCDLDAIVEDGLADFLDDLQREIWDVGDAIEAHFFRHRADLDLHAYEAG